MGAGTPLVEHVCSYLGRLAHAHCVSVQSMARDLAVRVRPVLGSSQWRRAFCAVDARSLNGLTMYSSLVVPLLQELTGNAALKEGCWLFAQDQLAKTSISLLVSRRRWCPLCYQDDLRRHGYCFDRLIWQVAPLTRCVVHEIPLADVCHKCGSAQDAVSRPEDRLRCTCGAALTELVGGNAGPPSIEAIAWQDWCFRQIVLLFENREEIASTPPCAVRDFMNELRDLTHSNWAKIDSWLEFKPYHARLVAAGAARA